VFTIHPANIIPSGSRIVPTTAGMTYDEATDALADEDLNAHRVDLPSESVDEDIVIRTDPAAGISVEKDSQVTVYVSSGPKMTTVPTLEGLTRAEAEDALDEAGLQLGQVRREDDPDTEADVVISASADAKDEVSEGTVVDLVVATGTVTVVDFTQQGYTLDAAQAALDELGLKVSVQDDPSCPANDPRAVKSQSAGPGEVPIHSDVILVSCSGDADAGSDTGE